jgi:hypothetical protein
VNTGDDFEHWGLAISPDVDTVMYTLAGLSHEERGWGLAEQSFHALEMVRRYGGDAWFSLGDRDLATHLLRTEALRRGERLTDVTARLCGALGVGPRVLPMSDGRRRTMIDADDGRALLFQDWFVRERAAPRVRRVWFDGAPPAAPEVLEAIEAADLVLFGPSNPYVSNALGLAPAGALPTSFGFADSFARHLGRARDAGGPHRGVRERGARARCGHAGGSGDRVAGPDRGGGSRPGEPRSRRRRARRPAPAGRGS